MIIIRRSKERRHIGNSNQNTWRTFDWENSGDPLQNGFGELKVFNEEILAPGMGFILHTQEGMVIVTYVQEGVIIYNGPLGVSTTLESGEIHQINVTSGKKQYAFNTSLTDEAHVFQSGFSANPNEHKQDDQKKLFTHAERKGILKLIASPDGEGASLKIQQDVRMYSTLIDKGNHVIHELKVGRSAWLHVVKGLIQMNEFQLQEGDGAGFSDERSVSFTGQKTTEILLIDMADLIDQTSGSEPHPASVLSPN